MKQIDFEFDDNIILRKNKFKNLVNESETLKNSSKKLSNFLKTCKNILAFLVFMIYAFLYNLSLTPCLKEESVCLSKIGFYYSVFYKVLYSSIFLGLLLFLIFKNIVFRIHIFYVSLSIIFFYNKDHQDKLTYHGYYNFLGLILFTVLCFFSLNIISIFITILLRKKYCIILTIFITFSILSYKLKIDYNDITRCDKWDFGLNDTKIDNNPYKYSCKIKKPKVCNINYTNRFSFLKFINKLIKCSSRQKSEKYSLRGHNSYVTDKTKRIGLPITAYNPRFQTNKVLSNDKMYENFLNDLIDMDNRKQLKSIPERFKPEIIINYEQNPYGEIEINLNSTRHYLKKEKKKKIRNLYMKMFYSYLLML